MCQLKLFFNGGHNSQLQETHFSHSFLDQVRIAYRGRTNGASQTHNAFLWSIGVQALCVLFVRTRAKLKDENAATISGDGATLAASLDYALSRQPNWLTDIFGSDSHGVCIARRIILRSNPERKRPGPVTLCVNLKALPVENIEVCIDGTIVTDTNVLEKLASQIESNSASRANQVRVIKSEEDTKWQVAKTKLENLESDLMPDMPRPFHLKVWRDYFQSITTQYITATLHRTDIFSKGSMAKLINDAQENPLFIRFAGRKAQLYSEIDLNLSSANRLGLLENENELKKQLCSEKAISCAYPIFFSPASAIFQYLKNIKGYNIANSYKYATTVELANTMVQGSFNEPPDLSVLSIAGAAILLKSRAAKMYRPLMMMPRIYHQVIRTKDRRAKNQNGSASKNKRHFLLPKELKGSELFYFDRLTRNGTVNTRNTVTENIEIDEEIAFFRECDSQINLVSGFPITNFNILLNNCEIVPEDNYRGADMEAILFAHESLFENKKKLTSIVIAIRDAWLELREGGSPLNQITHSMVNDKSFLTYAKRMAGLHVVREDEWTEKLNSSGVFASSYSVASC